MFTWTNHTNKLIRAVAMLLVVLAGTPVMSQQIRAFTPDSTVFPQELNTFFESIRIKESREKALSRLEIFDQHWQANEFDAQQKQLIYTTANLMLERRLKSYPDFADFLSVISTFKSSGISNENFDTWLESIRQSLEESHSSRNFSALLEFTTLFLTQNILRETRIYTWEVQAPKFLFTNDSVFSVLFSDADLICRSKNDSSIIHRTNGIYYPDSETWSGTGGTITWQRAGLDPQKVYAEAGNYQISTRGSDFTMRGVTFYHKDYLPGPLSGELKEKISTYEVTPDNAQYPQFSSEITNLFIENIFKDVDYEGGFAMKGAKILGKGNSSHMAKTTFRRPYRDKRGHYDLLIARSDMFVIERDRLYASQAAVSIYHQDDSIFHSGLQFKYQNDRREVSMLRIEEGIEQSPYFDTYHGVDIDCEAVYWNMDDPQIDFRSTKGLKTESRAAFISDQYYSEREFDYLQGLDYKHPLLWLRDYARTYNTKEFFIYELARFMKMPETQVEAQVIRLAQQGFLYYDVERKKATITDKTYHYIDAKNGKTDYDVITFFSKVQNQDNATLSLDNFDLTIRGVPEVSISDSQNVVIYPSSQEVVLRKNKDFLFSGLVKAGRFEFKAKNCSFEYDTFKLNLPTIENMRFKVRSFDQDEFGNAPLVNVKTVISNISGDMLIDHPDNKNGLKNYPEYPIFNSKTESYVFYDSDSTLKDAYNRKRFYYYIEPFELKSLESFSTDDIRFAGALHSDGILPDSLQEPLRVMPDYSLGFLKRTGAEGFQVYRGRGTFTNDIQLNLKGLTGNGTLDYLGSVSNSEGFRFFLDSVDARLKTFNIDKSVASKKDIPEVTGIRLNQHWMPYADSMTVSTTDTSLLLYGDMVRMRGMLALTPVDLSGKGKLGFFNASARSPRFVFAASGFTSDTTDLNLNDLDKDVLAFSTTNYAADVNFDKKTGHFKSNTDSSQVNFQVARYMAYMDAFDWQIDKNRIRLYGDHDSYAMTADTLSLKSLITAPPEGSKFVSLHPLQDSLSFYATSAGYDLATNTLTAEGVKIIKSADAAIFPGDGKVEIREGAQMQPLLDAVIIADTANRNHMITQAVVTVESKNSYRASGTYAFSNAAGDVQNIDFDMVTVDSLNHTVADGEVFPEQEFELNPVIGYRGKVHLNAGNPRLDFDGAFLIRQDCDPNLSRWVKFHQRINPDSLLLPVPVEPEEFGYKRLYTGFFHSNEENRIYPAFMSRRSYYSDTLMLSVNGWLTTRKKGQEFLVAPIEELQGLPENKDPDGPFMKLNTANCQVTAAGDISFGTDLGQVQLEGYGRIDHYLIPDSSRFNVFLRIDFFFADDALTYMMDDFNLSNAKGLDITAQPTSLALNRMLGSEQAGEVLTDIGLYGSLRNTPEPLDASIILSDVNLTYNKASRSFISDGPIGVAMIKGNLVNKYFDGYLEIVRKRSGDVLNLYLEIDRRHWYFFSYSNHVMQSISSQTDFNKILRDIKADDRQDEAEKGETAYRYIISTTQKKNRFLRVMRLNDQNEPQ